MSFVPPILTSTQITREVKSMRTPYTSFRGGMCFWAYKGASPTPRDKAIIEATAWPASRLAVSIDIELPGRAKQSVEMSREAFEAIGKALGYDMTREG